MCIEPDVTYLVWAGISVIEIYRYFRGLAFASSGKAVAA